MRRRPVLASLTPTGQRTADEVAPLMAAASTHATAQLAARGLHVPALNRALALVADPLDPPPTPEENP